LESLRSDVVARPKLGQIGLIRTEPLSKLPSGSLSDVAAAHKFMLKPGLHTVTKCRTETGCIMWAWAMMKRRPARSVRRRWKQIQFALLPEHRFPQTIKHKGGRPQRLSAAWTSISGRWSDSLRSPTSYLGLLNSHEKAKSLSAVLLCLDDLFGPPVSELRDADPPEARRRRKRTCIRHGATTFSGAEGTGFLPVL
jgi:hypothetical protein